MCGIVGKVYRERSRPVEREIIDRMKQCIVHRGPDEDGTHIAANVGFGFQRLAIIDLKCGQQPMYNEDGTVAIVFNGEIYNFQELREQLLSHGHIFKTHADTETILHGYEQWGPDVTRKLRGMFAFAISDTKDGTLFLARDRVGKKPLYYAHVNAGGDDEALLFASEMKSLLADPAIERRVDMSAVSHYLTYQYIPHPWSIFEGVKKLPPGHWLRYKNGDVHIERYWQVAYSPKTNISEEEAVERTLSEIDEAVRIRLMSEVPLGCFLSGGIDSSTVVAMMRRHISGDLKTFSIGFNEEKFNELPYARQVAQQFETHHEEFVVQPNALECLGALAWHFDEPFADTSAIPTYYLSKMTRQYVTVALNGDGGDESFAGYERYRGFRAFNRYRKIPRAARAFAGPAIEAAAGVLSANAKLELLNYVNRASLFSDERLYVQTMVIFRDYQKRALLAPEMGDDSENLTAKLMEAEQTLPLVDRMMFADIEMYLPGALLPKVDRMTMANSLEGRSPFLDHKLMEFAAHLPAEIKFRGGELKYLLKKALGKTFSHEFLHRPKMGFGVPIGDWFRKDLRVLTEEFLLGTRATQRGYFDRNYVRRILTQHMSGQQNHHHRLWTLLMFEAWCRTFLDRGNPLEGPISLN